MSGLAAMAAAVLYKPVRREKMKMKKRKLEFSKDNNTIFIDCLKETVLTMKQMVSVLESLDKRLKKIEGNYAKGKR